MPVAQLSPDTLDRTIRVLLDQGVVASLDEAKRLRGRWQVNLAIGRADKLTQAAAVTAAATGVRAVGSVTMTIDDAVASTRCTIPGLNTMTFGQALIAVGVRRPESNEPTPAGTIVTLVVGEADDHRCASKEPVLYLSWSGWSAWVTQDPRECAPDSMVLAPVASAALAVGEAFQYFLGQPDAGQRIRFLSLWQPWAAAGEADDGPLLEHLPDGVWLVGLGHLGQAYAWCWRLLPYESAERCTVVLQDVDRVTVANRSTGVLLCADDVGHLKTRVVSAKLEAAGLQVRLVERRIGRAQRLQPDEPTLALFGVDNPETRRQISSHQFALAVDAGLGASPIDYTTVAIKTFPTLGASADVASWQQNLPASPPSSKSARAYQEALSQVADDPAAQCGVVMAAGRAAAAAFVGMVAACLAVAEPLRLLNGDDGYLHGTAAATLSLARTRAADGEWRRSEPRMSYLPARGS